MSTESERIAILEYKDIVRERQLTEINDKLDTLLEMRQRGIGAFWLASALVGTGIIGAVTTFIRMIWPHGS